MPRFMNFKFSLRDKVHDELTKQIVEIYKKEYTEEAIKNSDQIKLIKAYYIQTVSGSLIEPAFRHEHQLKSVYL